MSRSLTTFSPLQLRAVMGRAEWAPPEEFGPAGWRMLARANDRSIIVSQARHDDGLEWIHASMTAADDVPTYWEMCRLKRAVWGDDGECYQIHPRKARHVNIQEHALHLWGRADGRPVLPDFGVLGSI